MKDLSESTKSPEQPFNYSLLRYSSYSINKIVNKIPNWRDKNILIVDSDETNTCLLKNYLTKTKATLINVPNGKKAIELCSTSLPIDLVIMDIRIPELKGRRATRSIRAVKKDLPIIAQACYAKKTEIKMAFDAGCDEFLEKPISQELLFKVLSKFLH